MSKMLVPQQITARRNHQGGDVGDSVTGWRRGPESRYLLIEDRSEHMMLGRVVAVERAQRDAGLRRDLLRSDVVDLLGGTQARGNGQNSAATTLLIIGHRTGRRPAF